jgi:hypothetical protein
MLLSFDCMALSCPQCETLLVYRIFPLLEEAVRRGEPAAVRQKTRRETFEDRKLRVPEQLPDVAGESVRLDMMYTRDEGSGENEFVISHAGTEIWRELAWWESLPRYIELKRLCKERYGERFDGLIPDCAATTWLLGDRWSWNDPECDRESLLLQQALAKSWESGRATETTTPTGEAG